LEKRQSLIPIVKSPARDAHLRNGSGFSLSEIKSAGYDIQTLKNLGIKIDYRRQSAREKNVELLQSLKISDKTKKKRDPFVAKEKKRTGYKPKTQKPKKKAAPKIKKEKVKEVKPKKGKIKEEKAKLKKEKAEIKPTEMGTPLTDLQGLGPATAAKLNELGVSSIEDLIKENPEEIGTLVKGLTAERISKWIEEGKELITK
jgi:predicted flap endonuclease-1-like 5' DNA nuclease